jgi:hypothetical protein
MPPRFTRRRSSRIAAVAILAVLAFAGTAAAVLSVSAGGAQLRMDNRGETAASFSNNPAWVDLPGASIPVNIANASGLVNARFTAESRCSGPNAGVCAVRIIAINAAGGIIELDPASGIDHAFDYDVPGAVDADLLEAHAMERSRRLAQGGYSVRVQRAVTNNTVGFTLDDWHLAVETSA